ncbi:hypothetical protein [Sorangium cellulosum]|uniref:hypothetical protein n=1 Tax=Sorangium TaxID=39643 RepID=UPI0012DB1D5A|nr:hypothetical protein [Sorangium cellulosum]
MDRSSLPAVSACHVCHPRSRFLDTLSLEARPQPRSGIATAGAPAEPLAFQGPWGEPRVEGGALLGIHERGEGGPRAEVHVSRTSEMVLALSSYTFTQWIVTVDEGAQLQGIVLVGHEPSRVTAPAGIPISTVIHDKDGARIEAEGHVPVHQHDRRGVRAISMSRNRPCINEAARTPGALSRDRTSPRRSARGAARQTG